MLQAGNSCGGFSAVMTNALDALSHCCDMTHLEEPSVLSLLAGSWGIQGLGGFRNKATPPPGGCSFKIGVDGW